MKAELGLWVLPELRVRVAARRYRIPDVTVLPASAPPAADYRAGELQEKLDDYVEMGVENIWVVNPRSRRLFTADALGMHAVTSFAGRGSGYVISQEEIFAELEPQG